MSLITGKSRHNDFSTAAEKINDQLISRDEGLAVIHHSGAGQFKFCCLNLKNKFNVLLLGEFINKNKFHHKLILCPLYKGQN